MVHKGTNKIKSSRTRGKRLKSSNNEDWGPWSELPKDLLYSIVKELNLIDYFSFGGVCKSWRFAIVACRQEYMASQPPFIIVLSKHAKKTCALYNMFDGSMYKTRTSLPFFSGNKCIGFSCGYSVWEMRSLWLVNLLTKHEYHLLLTHPVLLKYSAEYRARRVIFASSAMGSSGTLILSLSIFFTFSVLHIYQSGDLSMTLHRFNLQSELLVDIAVFKGKVYALTNRAKVGILNLYPNLDSCPRLTLLGVESIRTLSSFPHFVASNEQLLMVDFRNEKNFKIYELDFVRMEWVKVESLGDQALFLSKDMCIGLRDVTKWGGHSNCIYSIDPYNTLCCYSLDGIMLESSRITKRGNKPLDIAQTCWYFPHQAYSIPTLSED